MFLEDKYFIKHIFKSVYNKITKRLKNKGIVLFHIDTVIEKLKRAQKNNISNLTFDESPFPNTNTLYIHLFNNQYFSEKLYNKKKVETEREMLFLLAGKLGVKQIYYEIEVIETTISKVNTNLKIKGINNGLTFNKHINKTNGTKGKEEYLNRGAPVYLKSESLQKVEENIKERMGMMKSNIFNYNFYKNNPKLESFVYKRYEFKIQKLEYNLETDDLSDISFAVNSCFMEYGIDLSYDKSTSYNENIHYTIEFYNDIELYKEFGKNKRNQMDEFYSIRELYELMDNKDKSVHLITEYVMKLAKNYKYKYNDEIHNFSKHIDDFIKNNDDGSFESICHEFHSTSQIKNWLNKKFLINEMEIINDNLKENVEDINNNINNNITVDEIINDCDEGSKHMINRKESLSNWDVEENKSEPIINLPFGLNDSMFAHYLCTMVNPPETFRPPIMPSSSTTSINSDIFPSSFKPIQNERESDI
uniref:Uncharacterized protein n=1 Tax=viral metagenome TaxID=1070528 RepID=A0A6C0HVE1_9ZZZZ